MSLRTNDLERYVSAQDRDGSYDRALDELRRGRKTSHWMWFVLPQLRGLGRSATAHEYGIADVEQARRYAAHPVLGPRLRECCRALLALPEGTTAAEVLGDVDALKLRSCVTLFRAAAPDDPLFEAVLSRYYDAAPDPRTEELLTAG